MSDPTTEQKRLEATALVASRVSREESQSLVRKAQIRTFFREAILAILVIAVALLSYRNATESSRTRKATLHIAQVNCQQYHDVATIPLEPGTTGVGIHIVADFRNAYYAYDCQDRHGNLPKPDPRILPFLSKDARQ